jgi:hypothetical protein
LDRYIEEKGDKNGYVKFIDLYNYQSGKYGTGQLVKDLCLAMRNGYNFAKVDVSE